MALTDKKYEKFYKTTGVGDDKIESVLLTKVETLWDSDRGEGCKYLLNDPTLGPIVFQLQQLQDELDYLRTEISNNKDKTGITNSQASAITANTAKTGITTQQAKAITDNTTATSDNVGEIKKLDTSVTNNSSTITSLIKGKLEVMPNRTGSSKQQLICGVIERNGVYNLNFVYEDVDRSGKTFTKTGSIQLK